MLYFRPRKRFSADESASVQSLIGTEIHHKTSLKKTEIHSYIRSSDGSQ